jgi:putative ABC transport system substrate-binding protein
MLILSHAAGTQQAGRVYRIGFLGVASASASVTQRRIEAFRTGMRALGYVEGSNLIIEFRWAEGDANRLAELAGDLIRLRVDLLVTQGSTSTRIAKVATSTIPIVMLAVGDAVGAGLVASLARPGGNVTGSTFLGQQIYAKQLELLKEAIPSVARVAVFMNPDNPANGPVLQSLEAVGHGLKVVLMETDARGPAEYEGAFRAMEQQRADALIVSADASLTANARAIAGLAVKHRLPATSAWSDFTESGGLLGYGPNIYDLYGRAAPRFVDQILRGAKPAELPVEQPTKFDLVINLKTAKVLGITIPPSLLLRADAVIQ